MFLFHFFHINKSFDTRIHRFLGLYSVQPNAIDKNEIDRLEGTIPLVFGNNFACQNLFLSLSGSAVMNFGPVDYQKILIQDQV